MIDEKKLIERIRQEPTDGMFTHEIVEAIEEQPKIGEWIPCNKRLPDDPEGGIPHTREEVEWALIKDTIKQYIVMIDGATEPTMLFYGGDDRWYDQDGRLYPCRVIAWMPLPEPYQGETRKEAE